MNLLTEEQIARIRLAEGVPDISAERQVWFYSVINLPDPLSALIKRMPNRSSLWTFDVNIAGVQEHQIPEPQFESEHDALEGLKRWLTEK